MSEYKNKKQSAHFAQHIYRAAKMGSDSIAEILSKTKDVREKEKIRGELAREFAEYEKIASKAHSALMQMNVKPKEEGLMVKMMSKTGIAMNLWNDSTSSHISDMVIQGLTMGITDTTKRVRMAKEHGCDERIIKLGDNLVSFQEDSANELKKYL